MLYRRYNYGMGILSVRSSNRNLKGTTQHSNPVISISVNTWTVQLAFMMTLSHIAWAPLYKYCLK